MHSRPPELGTLAQWLTERHDAATKAQGANLDDLYRLLAAAAQLQEASQQVLPVQSRPALQAAL